MARGGEEFDIAPAGLIAEVGDQDRHDVQRALVAIGSPLSGTFTAIDSATNKIAWQHKMPYRMGGGGGSTVTAGGLLLRGEPDGNFVAVDAKTGEMLWKFQTGFGADAPPMV